MFRFLSSPRSLALPVVAFLSSILLGVSGCGSGAQDGNEVEGMVKLGGTPLTGGMIVFVSKADPKLTASSGVDSRGHFRIVMAPLGLVSVQIQPGPRSSDPQAPPPPNIPKKYQSANTTDLSYEVKKGKQTKDFELAP